MGGSWAIHPSTEICHFDCRLSAWQHGVSLVYPCVLCRALLLFSVRLSTEGREDAQPHTDRTSAYKKKGQPQKRWQGVQTMSRTSRLQRLPTQSKQFQAAVSYTYSYTVQTTQAIVAMRGNAVDHQL